MTREEELDIRQELRIANKVIEEYKEENENLLKALIGLVDQIENEHCSEYIDELQEEARKAIEKAQS